MRFVSFRVDSTQTARWGYLAPDGDVVDCTAIAPSLLDYIRIPPQERPQVSELSAGFPRYSEATVAILAPIPAPVRNVFAVGANYRAHVEESAQSEAEPWTPIFFSKATTTVTGSGIVEVDPRVTERVDWEIELAVVIGGNCKAVSVERAGECVFGYAIANDISARDVQHGRPENQWFLGKSLDGFCPMGPWLVTPDEAGPVDQMQLRLSVGGSVQQSGTPADLIFDIPAIISELARHVTLLPGDIILTGTPGGVGGAQVPPRFLKHGEVMTAEITGLGSLVTELRYAEQSA